jgi:hypothetical protein
MQFKANNCCSLEVGRYKGKHEIKIGSIWKDGNFHVEFKTIKKKDGTEQNIPNTITFDDDELARKFHIACLAGLGEKVDIKNKETDVPF